MPPSLPGSPTKGRKNAEIQYVDICVVLYTWKISREDGPCTHCSSRNLTFKNRNQQMPSGISIKFKGPAGSQKVAFRLSTVQGKASNIQEVPGTSGAVRNLRVRGKKWNIMPLWSPSSCHEDGSCMSPAAPQPLLWLSREEQRLAERSREALAALQMLELIPTAGPGHGSVLSSGQLSSPLCSLVCFGLFQVHGIRPASFAL